MAQVDNDSNESSFFVRLISSLLLLMTLGLGLALIFIVQAQDLSDVEGHSEAELSSSSRDVAEVLRKSLEGQYSVVITEEEINQMIGDTLEIKQGGVLASIVSMKSVAIRLEDGYAEVIVARDISGVDFTSSIFIQLEQVEDNKGIKTQVHLHGGAFNESFPSFKRGGKFGKMTVPQGFLMMLMPEFEKLAKVLEPEINLSFRDMARFEIQEGRLLLDPKRPSKEMGGNGNSF